jgi:hypothetical protein
MRQGPKLSLEAKVFSPTPLTPNVPHGFASFYKEK